MAGSVCACLRANDSPRFEDYPAQIIQDVKSAPVVRFKTRGQREYRTMIRMVAKTGPNFAGHYAIAEWGCGTGCVQMAIVDVQSGEVYDGPFGTLPKSLLYLGAGVEGDNTGIFYKTASRLLIARGCPNYKSCGTYYYEWSGSLLRLLVNVPMKPLFGSFPD
jgi:hypothetical protein